MIGEFGFGASSPLRRTVRESQWQDGTLKLVRENGLNFTQHDTIDADTWVAGGAVANLPAGIKVGEHLTQYKPMQFSR